MVKSIQEKEVQMKGKSKPLILVLSSNFLKIILIVLGITIKEGGG